MFPDRIAGPDELPRHEARLAETDSRVDYILMRLPNLPADDAPDGLTEADNRVIRTHGPDVASFAAGRYLPHWEIATALGIYDGERGAKISGSMSRSIDLSKYRPPPNSRRICR